MQNRFLLIGVLTVLSSLLACAKNDDTFRVRIEGIAGESSLADYNPEARTVSGTVMRKMNGSDGGEYYHFKLDKPFRYERYRKPLLANYLIVGGRFAGQLLTQNAKQTVINIAVVTDESLIKNDTLDFNKAFFAAFGEATGIE